jgi:enoyl-[acyl-carrier protein] reductase III
MSPGRVLVTGGTRGIGRAIAMEVVRHGGTVCVTHRWGSVEPEELSAAFRAEGLSPPRMEACDASVRAETAALLQDLHTDWGGIDGVVSGVAFGAPVADLADLRRSSLEIAMGYGTWPLLDLVQLGLTLPEPPRRFVALSSEGVDVVLPGYDMLGVSKAALETLVRYLAMRLRDRGIPINALRPGYVDTESFRTALPSMVEPVAARRLFMEARVAGRAAVALLSGLLDGMTGQVITVDEGASLLPPV